MSRACSGIMTSAVRHSPADGFTAVTEALQRRRLQAALGGLGQADWDQHQRLTTAFERQSSETQKHLLRPER